MSDKRDAAQSYGLTADNFENKKSSDDDNDSLEAETRCISLDVAVSSHKQDAIEGADNERIFDEGRCNNREEMPQKKEEDDENDDVDTGDYWTCGPHNQEVASGHVQSFPPPISILSNISHYDLPRHMPRVFWRSFKRDGRFVMQEVRVCQQEFFTAIRENGRLRLYMIPPHSNEKIIKMTQERLASSVIQELPESLMIQEDILPATLDSSSEELSVISEVEGKEHLDEAGLHVDKIALGLDFKSDEIEDELSQISEQYHPAALGPDHAAVS